MRFQSATSGGVTRCVGHAPSLNKGATTVIVVAIQGENAIVVFGERDRANAIGDASRESGVKRETKLSHQIGWASRVVGDGAVAGQAGDIEIQAIEVKNPVVVDVQQEATQAISHIIAAEAIAGLEHRTRISEAQGAILHADHGDPGTIRVERVASATDLEQAGPRFGEIPSADPAGKGGDSGLIFAGVNDGFREQAGGTGPEQQRCADHGRGCSV